MIRRTTFRILAFFLVLLVGTGGVAPLTWAWQCHHSFQLAAVPFASPGTMPCQIADSQRTAGTMACCRVHSQMSVGGSRTRPSFTASGCKPAFTELAGIPAVSVGQSSQSISAALAGADATFVLAGNALPQPITLVMRQRPPPDAGIPASSLHPIPSLRGPPIA